MIATAFSIRIHHSDITSARRVLLALIDLSGPISARPARSAPEGATTTSSPRAFYADEHGSFGRLAPHQRSQPWPPAALSRDPDLLMDRNAGKFGGLGWCLWPWPRPGDHCTVRIVNGKGTRQDIYQTEDEGPI